jgi:hypothetical protein
MHIHLRIHHWVLWWFGVGIVCGVVALVNIFSRDLTRVQDRIVLAIGVLFWLLGGLVCYAYDSVEIEEHSRTSTRKDPRQGSPQEAFDVWRRIVWVDRRP